MVLGSCWHRLVEDTNILLRLGPRVVVVVVVVGGPALHPPLWSRGVCMCGWVGVYGGGKEEGVACGGSCGGGGGSSGSGGGGSPASRSVP